MDDAERWKAKHAERLAKLQGNDQAWNSLNREFAAHNPLRFIQACASCMDQLNITERLAVHDRVCARYLANTAQIPGLSQESLDAARMMLITAQLLIDHAVIAESLRQIDNGQAQEPPQAKGP